MSEYRAEIYVDGACVPNPGVGGCAAILIAYDAVGMIIKKREITARIEVATNNRAELYAAVIGLRALAKYTQVTVISDSQYVIKSMNGDWRQSSNLDLFAELNELASMHGVTWQWVKGHSGIEFNERADKLSLNAISGRVIK